MFSVLRSILAVALSSYLVVSGASAPIGVVKAGGDFRLAGASVRGNGTLFAGDTIESDNLRTNVIVNGGKQLTLAPHSRGKVFAEKAILEAGVSELRTSTAYALEAGSFRLSMQNGRALVGYTPESGKVRVTASEGRVAVRNGRGMLIAEVRQGRTLDFESQGSGASSAVEYTGKVRKTGDGKYVLTDETTEMSVELQGNRAELEKNIGKRVRVRGAVIAGETPAAGATAVVSVTSVAVTTTATGAALSGGAIAAIVGTGAAGGIFLGMAAADAGPFGKDASN